MKFPNLALWSSDPEDALGRMDRAINDRNHRLVTGLSVPARFDKIQGVLVVSQGNGKYLRLRHVVSAEAPVVASVRDGCLAIACGDVRDLGQVSQVTSDLAEIQANLVERLKCEAGKYVDRVLAVCVADPGIWDCDFDGRSTYSSFCDPVRLAELTGVTVISDFPARDLAAQGTGQPLTPIPYWLMFADRNQKIAQQTTALVSLGESCLTYLLPPSDGRDADVPGIQVKQSIGLGFLERAIRDHLPSSQNLKELDLLYADGRFDPHLRDAWKAIWTASQSHRPLENSTVDKNTRFDKTLQALADQTLQYLQAHSLSFANVLRTGIRWIVNECLDQLQQSQQPADRLIVACPPLFEAGLINQFDQLSTGSVVSTRKSGIDFGSLPATVAAMLGLLHIDQMPANVPWLTGADCQRILGNITPGSPSNWRQLVRVMADFHPAPMKLKDAI